MHAGGTPHDYVLQCYALHAFDLHGSAVHGSAMHTMRCICIFRMCEMLLEAVALYNVRKAWYNMKDSIPCEGALYSAKEHRVL